MSLLNFIAGGLGVGGRPNQVISQPSQCSTALYSSQCIRYSSPNSSPTLSYISKASTNNQYLPAQPNIDPKYSFYREYYSSINTPNTPMAISRQDPILHAFNSFFANPYKPPSTTINGRDFAYQKLQNREQILEII